MARKLSMPLVLVCAVLWAAAIFSSTARASGPSERLMEDDAPLSEKLSLPAWFKLSFLDIGEDISEANRNQRGLILYFGHENCPYCRALIEHNWRLADIVNYTRANFDVVAIDVRGQRMVTALDGKEYTEKAFAIKRDTNFTPTLLFYDKHGELALRLSGYRPPYQFRAALEYVADDHHRREDFHHYLARAEPAFSFGQEELNPHPALNGGPVNLARLSRTSGRPLLVSFERGRCHACDILHAGPLNNPGVRDLLRRLEAAQVDMRSNMRITDPGGRNLPVNRWVDELGLSYAPSLLFFDQDGKEILRVDSVVGFYRLSGILEYIVTGAYRDYPTFQQWRQQDGVRQGQHRAANP